MNKRKGVEVALECFPIDLTGGPFNPPEDVRGLSKINQVGKMVLMCSARKTYVDFRDIKLKLSGNQKIDAEIHFSNKS